MKGQVFEMPKNLYPKEMTVTDEGKALQSIWRRIKKNVDEFCPFMEYPKFYCWAMDHYYCLGSRLRRYDETLPYSPDNCWFMPPKEQLTYLSPEQKSKANQWNKTVNVLRKACGMKLFDVYDEEEKYA